MRKSTAQIALNHDYPDSTRLAFYTLAVIPDLRLLFKTIEALIHNIRYAEYPLVSRYCETTIPTISSS